MSRPLHPSRAMTATAVSLVALLLWLPAPARAEPPTSPPAAQAEPAAEPDSEPAPVVHASEPVESAAARLFREAQRAAEADLAALEQFEAVLARRGELSRAASAAARERIVELTAALRSLDKDPQEAERIYDDIARELSAERPALRAGLDALGDPSAIPPPPPSPDLDGLDAPALREEIARIEQLRGEADDLRARLPSEEREARWREVEQHWERVVMLQVLRFDCLPRLPVGRRSLLLGLGPTGIAQVGREWEQLTLTARYRYELRARHVRELPTRASDLYAVGLAGWTLVKVLAVIVVLLWMRRRIPDLTQRLRGAELRERALGSVRSRQRRVVAGVVDVVAPWGLFLIAVWAAGRVLEGWGQVPEIAVPLDLAWLYGLYRLAIEVLGAASVSVARRYRIRVDDERRAKIVRSVVVFLRLAVGVVLIRQLAEALVGRGSVYHLVGRLAWLVVVLTAMQVLIGWRTVIADAYLEAGPPGALERMVRASRDRWYGVFVAAAAFAWLAGHGLLVLARDFAMGFDQTRKALAFLFRRQVERQAGKRGYAEGDPSALPSSLREAFTEDCVGRGAPVHGRFPGLERMQAGLAGWVEHGGRGSFLLDGERGMGKSSWLAHVDPGELPCARVVLAHRSWHERGVMRVLWQAIEGGENEAPRTASEAGERLLAGPRRLIIVDVGQNLFLATVGGFAAMEAFATLVDTTCRHVYWVFAINAFTWAHVTAVRPDLQVFRDRETLEAWTEEDIRALVDTRMSAAGVEATFEDLAADQLQGLGGRERQERLEQTREAFTRLLWDYTDGNPRAASHFWLRALVPESETRVRVRPFRTPDGEALAVGGDAGLFALSAIVLHENLTLAELARVTRYPEGVCRTHVDRFRDMGALRLDDGRYRVTSHWHRAVVHRLRRSNLLPLLG